jgi:hypothetical protein
VPADPTAVDIAEAGYVVPVEPKLGSTPADAIEQLRPFVELGVRHFQIFFVDYLTPHGVQSLVWFRLSPR